MIFEQQVIHAFQPGKLIHRFREERILCTKRHERKLLLTITHIDGTACFAKNRPNGEGANLK